MEVEIASANLETIKAIAAIIMNIRSKPQVVRRIQLQTQMLSFSLGALHRKYQNQILSNANTNGWLEHQKACNMILCNIENILKDYAKGSASRFSIVYVAIFQAGQKRELSRLSDDLEKSVVLLHRFADLVLPEPQLMQLPQQHDHQLPREQEPVMSIGQFVQMRAMLDKAVGLPS